MNIFNKVTMQSLKKNKTRTIVTIIGIMLSAAMICAVTTFVASMQNYVIRFQISKEGNWHGMVHNAAQNNYEEIHTCEKVSHTAYGQILGYAEIGSANEFKPYLFVMGGEKDNFFDTMSINLILGEYPKNSTEIILPEHLSSNGGVTYKIGDTITLDIGLRMFEGYPMWQSNPNYSYDPALGEDVPDDETIDVQRTVTYTVVGIYQRPSFENYTAPGYTALTVADESAPSDALYDIYFRMKKPKDVYSFLQNLNLGSETNTDLLTYMGVSRYSSFSSVLIGLASIVTVLIVFGSVSLIYNAFSISVSERTKQFGLLSSIGATKKQLRRMVLFEALSVSIVGIPLGILVGIGGIGATLYLMGDEFASITGSYDVPMRICVTWEAIVIAVVIALLTVLISAWIPSKRATKVSAVEAIRQSMDIKAKNKPVRTSKLTYKLFGLPGVLASKHYKRNKRKYRTTVVSLFMSIVLFVSASSFSSYLMESVQGSLGFDRYDISIYGGENEFGGKTPEELLKIINSCEAVTDSAYTMSNQIGGSISSKYITEQYAKSGEYYYSNGEYDENIYHIGGYVYFIDDDNFKKLLNKYNLNKDDYFDSENPLAIVVDGEVYFDTEQEKYVTLNILKTDKCEITLRDNKKFDGYYYMGETVNDKGLSVCRYQSYASNTDVMEIPIDEAMVSFTIKTGKRITELPFYIMNPRGISVIYPTSMLESVIEDELLYSFNYNRIYVTSSNHEASYEAIALAFTENGIPSDGIYDHAASADDSRNIVSIIKVFSYGFVILISLIAAANVFNTISTNIALRRREFAMLKSVGMSKSGFNKMMNYECLLYGFKSLLLGIPVSCVVTYFIYMAISEGYETTFKLPFGAMAIAALSVFAVVFVTMLYSMSKIKKDNPIDALKNENQ